MIRPATTDDGRNMPVITIICITKTAITFEEGCRKLTNDGRMAVILDTLPWLVCGERRKSSGFPC